MDSIDRFSTPRLDARRVSEADLDDLLQMDRDPRIMRTMGGVRSDEDTQEYLQRNLEHWNRYGYGLWLLRLRDSKEFVGRVYIRHLDLLGKDEVALGYAFMPDYWGQGLATEAAQAVVDIALTRLGLKSIVSGVLPENRASHHVVEKIGGRYEQDIIYKGLPHVFYRIEAAHGQDLE